ncbi:NIPSNAP family protein [Mycolicibacterium frederiksbergense]|uniref:NIPSNAP family protein n=1 Tax=Mycolicibacterium frederiksbergense TaxID=117567 RepID=UPI00399BDA09
MEMRTYTLADDGALQRYVSTFWPRHIQSLQKYGITVHGVWIEQSSGDRRVVALVGYRPGEDPRHLAESYRNSVDFVDDHANFDIELITSTHTVRLDPIPSSPLRWDRH